MSDTREIIGKIHPPKTMFLREAAGTIKDGAGNEYELTTALPSRAPIVFSEQTKRYYTLSWEDIARLAIEAGIDEKGEA